ncbi:hypothetical protein NW762_012848 [Fusarium torreyae]|uniref:Uncharacterized protein n=1 Tax=Fusarium torreyae TaxID=1237075 RepID=A0A9W8VAZ1_9HYPO|nr:hypothetical protein NW762_012848 [Fusarium torreyae]
MELVGIVRCPVDSLFPYGKGRQIDQDAVDRIWKYFDKTERRPSDERNQIRGIVTPGDLNTILSTLHVTRQVLKSTIQQGGYPLLSDHRIACLDGKHRLRALAQNRPLSWWVVRLYCVQGSWLRFPFQLSTSSANRQALQDQVEYTSHEIPYSDAEIYRLVRKYMRAKDKLRERECRARLTSCKNVSLKGLLKNFQLVQDLDALDRFPGVTGGLKLGNVHKHLALHIDEQISHYLRHILSVWKDITGDNPRVNAAVDLETVQCLQFRAPSTSEVDKLAIRRMFTDGTLFRGLKDLDLRDVVRDKVLSVQVIIPSLETFHENMKYISLGAKFLREHFAVPLQDNRRETPTLYQSLGDDWSDPGAYYVEVADSRLESVTGRPTRYSAYKHLFIAVLRHFARLTANHPRQDVRGETMPSFPERSRIQYLTQLARSQGFDNVKITGILNSESGHPSVPDYVPRAGTPADWRGGIPFTKNYISLQSLAFPPQLEGPADRGRRSPSTLFVMQDIIDAFFEKTNDLASLGGEQRPLVPSTQQHIPSSNEDRGLSDEEDLYSATDREEDVEMAETGRDTLTHVMEDDKAIDRRSMVNMLGPRSRRIAKERPKSAVSEGAGRSIPIDEDTMHRQAHRSPHFLSEEDLRATISHDTSPALGQTAVRRGEDSVGGQSREGRTRSIAGVSRRSTVRSTTSTTNSTQGELHTLREPQAVRQGPPTAGSPGAASAHSTRPNSLSDGSSAAGNPATLRGFLPARSPAHASVRSKGSSEHETDGLRQLAVDSPVEMSPDEPTTLREIPTARRPQRTTSSHDEDATHNSSSHHSGGSRRLEADFPADLNYPPATIREPQIARPPPEIITGPSEVSAESLTSSDHHGGSSNEDEIGMIQPLRADRLRQLEANHVVDAYPQGFTTLREPTPVRRLPVSSWPTREQEAVASRCPETQETLTAAELAYTVTSVGARSSELHRASEGSRQNTLKGVEAEDHVFGPGTPITSGFSVTDVGPRIAEVLGAHHHFPRRARMDRPRKGTAAEQQQDSPSMTVGSRFRRRQFIRELAKTSPIPVWPLEKAETFKEKRKHDPRMSLRAGWPWTGFLSGSLSPTNMTSQPTLAEGDDTMEVEDTTTSKPDKVPPVPTFDPVPPIRRMRPQRRPTARLQYQSSRTRTSHLSQASQSQYSQDSQASHDSVPSRYSQDSEHYSQQREYYSQYSDVGPPPSKRLRLNKLIGES